MVRIAGPGTNEAEEVPGIGKVAEGGGIVEVAVAALGFGGADGGGRGVLGAADGNG